MKIAVDDNGNINMLGTFQDSMVFRNKVVHSGTYIPCHFLAHLDSNYNLKWFRIISYIFSFIGDESIDLAIVNDKNGNIYIGGSFTNVIDLDSFNHIYPWLSYYTHQPIFLAKYDTSGHVLWHKQSIGDTYTNRFTIGVDSMSNIYFSAVAIGQVEFGTDTVSFDTTGAFVTKFDSAGNHIWFSKLPGTKKVHDFQTDLSGNCFVVGNCTDTQTCGIDTVFEAGTNAFLVKCSTDGTPQWQQVLKSGSINTGYSVGVGTDGKPTIVGSFRDSLPVNTIPSLFSIDTIPEKFFIRYDTNGTPVWAIRSSSDVFYRPSYIVPPYIGYAPQTLIRVDRMKNSYTSGFIDIAPILVDTANIYMHNLSSYIVKIDTSYNVLCTIKIHNGLILDYCLSSDNSLYVIGKMRYYIVINDDTTYSISSGTSYVGASIYLAKFDQNCNLLHLEIINSPQIALEGVPVLSNDNVPSIYPNPTCNELYVSGLSSRAEYQILNMVGVAVQKGTMAKGANILETGQLLQGLYLLQLIDVEGKKTVVRFLKQ